jgi:hypothetical protein
LAHLPALSLPKATKPGILCRQLAEPFEDRQLHALSASKALLTSFAKPAQKPNTETFDFNLPGRFCAQQPYHSPRRLIDMKSFDCTLK